jgi:hypothetical protein
MNLFGKPKMKQFEKAIAELRQRADRLTSKRETAKNEFAAAQTAREEFFLGGDIDDAKISEKLQSRVDGAAGALAALDAALATLAAQLSEAERALLDERQRLERDAAADALARDVAKIEAQIGPWLDATRNLAADLGKLGTVRFDAGQIGAFIADAAGQAEIALAVCIPDLQGAVEAVAAGREPIPRAEPVPEPVKAVAPPETTRLFFLRAAKFSATGGMHLIGRYTIGELPPEIAKRALKRNVAVALSDPRCKQLHNTWPTPPRASDCENLDGDDAASSASTDKPAQSAAEPVRHSAFAPIDRGPAISGRMRSS